MNQQEGQQECFRQGVTYVSTSLQGTGLCAGPWRCLTSLTPLVFRETFSKSQLSQPTSSPLKPQESLLSPVQHCSFNWYIIMPLSSLILSHLQDETHGNSPWLERKLPQSPG